MTRFEILSKMSNKDLLGLINFELLEPVANKMARRILKDRLEGLDEMVKSEVLHDKIASA
jgi:hypothetical protein